MSEGSMGAKAVFSLQVVNGGFIITTQDVRRHPQTGEGHVATVVQVCEGSADAQRKLGEFLSEHSDFNIGSSVVLPPTQPS